MPTKANEFRDKVQALMRKYGALYGEGDDYDSDEEYAGSTPYVVVGGERFTLSELVGPREGEVHND